MHDFADVRELIPEFFCLPEFLTNANKINFGVKEGDKTKVDHVQLPSWAQNKAVNYIAAMREALESPYVSQNLD